MIQVDPEKPYVDITPAFVGAIVLIGLKLANIVNWPWSWLLWGVGAFFLTATLVLCIISVFSERQ